MMGFLAWPAVRYRNWSDDQRQWGPFTVSGGTVYSWGIVLDSGGSEDSPAACHLRLHSPWGVLLIELPQIIPPYRERHQANWDAETIKRLGRDWYDVVYPREYGVTLSDGHLSIEYGRQTHDSSTEQRWGCFLPWTQWRHVRYSLYDLDGEHFWTEAKPPKGAKRWRGLQSWDVKRKLCPAALFEFEDYDGARITARAVIEEREWRFGTGWFRWLSLFRRRKVRRSLDLEFSAEVGPEKGSWKGGTVGSGIDMLPGELHEDAFKRYCATESRSKPHRLKYLGRWEEHAEGAADCQSATPE